MKNRTHKRFASYRKHVIWYDTLTQVFLVAIKKNGMDSIFANLEDAYDAIDEIEDNK
jgi:hypothetical protein